MGGSGQWPPSLASSRARHHQPPTSHLGPCTWVHLVCTWVRMGLHPGPYGSPGCIYSKQWGKSHQPPTLHLGPAAAPLGPPACPPGSTWVNMGRTWAYLWPAVEPASNIPLGTLLLGLASSWNLAPGFIFSLHLGLSRSLSLGFPPSVLPTNPLDNLRHQTIHSAPGRPCSHSGAYNISLNSEPPETLTKTLGAGLYEDLNIICNLFEALVIGTIR